MTRRKSKQVMVGGVSIGAESPVSVQSMTNTPTNDVEKTLRQIRALAKRGCDIVRISVYDEACAKAVKTLVDKSPVPLVADIHFDYKLAVLAAENGIAKIRINPGNIGPEENVRCLAQCAKAHHIPIRVGVNSGSIERSLLEKYGPTPRAMAESALQHARMLEKWGFDDLVLAIKATHVQTMVEANRQVAALCDYPIHVGVTEAGTKSEGTVKSAIGIGTLLMEGIGDTIRVSLSGSPLPEVDVGIQILKSCGLRNQGVTVVSCPTCGRCCIDVESIARAVKQKTKHIVAPITVAVMGCVVNGPGEAKQADVGIAGAPGGCALFMGEKTWKVEKEQALDELLRCIEALI